MNLRSRLLPALGAGVLSACLLACVLAGAAAPPAFAGTPAAVTVRVEGLTETKLPATPVTTTTTPVVKDGVAADSCSGTSALGALELATAGNWSGPWFSGFHQYLISTVLGETHEFVLGAEANYSWSLWIDDRESEVGACEAELAPGDRMLLFPSCYEGACPPEQLPLEVEPASVSANVGEPVSFTVRRYSRSGEGTPLAGASVAGGGTATATDASGHAALTFAHAGQVTIGVGATGGVRTEASVCIHAGNDGTCGTSAPGAPASEAAAKPPYLGPYALVANLRTLHEHRTYSRRSAPRLLAGTVLGHSAVTSVSLRLRRRWHGRCQAYDGVRQRFVKARCGAAARYFKVSGGASFSYLLPAALQPGRYVLDIDATDAAGNHTTLARGSTRTVFFVR